MPKKNKGPLDKSRWGNESCTVPDETDALTQESTRDYVLQGDSVWITVGKLSVYVKRTDEGVAVDVYPHGDENSEAIASTWATENEAPDLNPQNTDTCGNCGCLRLGHHAAGCEGAGGTCTCSGFVKCQHENNVEAEGTDPTVRFCEDCHSYVDERDIDQKFVKKDE